MQLRSFRLAFQFDAAGRFDAGTSVLAEAGCADLGAVGLFLRLFRLCNRAGDFVSVGTIRGAPYDGAASHRPPNVRVATIRLLEGRRSIEAAFEAQGYRLADHLAGIVLIDETAGRAVQMDYRSALASTSDDAGNLATAILTLPEGVAIEPGRPVRAIVVTDLFPLASVLIE